MEEFHNHETLALIIFPVLIQEANWRQFGDFSVGDDVYRKKQVHNFFVGDNVYREKQIGGKLKFGSKTEEPP
ncbi:hypothetical protein HanPSC8_Chr08g0314111 [Helianthus annuus]|nr:hypothetical protein HanPSC8_Chr08g0314111 [Helianthus annuus]